MTAADRLRQQDSFTAAQRALLQLIDTLQEAIDLDKTANEGRLNSDSDFDNRTFAAIASRRQSLAASCASAREERKARRTAFEMESRALEKTERFKATVDLGTRMNEETLERLLNHKDLTLTVQVRNFR